MERQDNSGLTAGFAALDVSVLAIRRRISLSIWIIQSRISVSARNAGNQPESKRRPKLGGLVYTYVRICFWQEKVTLVGIEPDLDLRRRGPILGRCLRFSPDEVIANLQGWRPTVAKTRLVDVVKIKHGLGIGRLRNSSLQGSRYWTNARHVKS